jgi:RNA polymerase sigma-70 factor (ECF subfamily)
MKPDDPFYSRERARLLSALTRLLGAKNLALAEDVAQETLARAFEVWTYRGVPAHYSALLMTAAKNRAIDMLRRERTRLKLAPAIERAVESERTSTPAVEEVFLPAALRDDELRMMFSCCHPRLAEEVQVALILNLLCGLSAGEIARVYLAGEAAIEKRLSRGKKVLAEAPHLFELTEVDFAPRLQAVSRALYVLFSEGYHGASEEAVIREDLCREALRLVRLLVDHAPAATPATCALAALMYLLAARLPGRKNELGELLSLADQDRARWDAQLASEGLALLERASIGTEVSRYHVEAAIAGLHASAQRAQDTRWDRIVNLYDLYMQIAPSPIVALNRAMAVAELEGPRQGLRALAAIQDVERMRDYPFYPAARGELELRSGRPETARAHFEAALGLARNDAERRFLNRRLEACAGASPSARPGGAF